MDKEKNSSRGRERSVSPGSIGGRIKKYRELCGLTQRELGLKCGFPKNSADVRIAQYETNTRTPKGDTLQGIADALDVDSSALADMDLTTTRAMYQALFSLEDLHGLHPVRIGNDYYLELTGDSILGLSTSHDDCQNFLRSWYEERQKNIFTPDDSKADQEQKKREYDLWRGRYPESDSSIQEQHTQDEG